MKKSFSDFYINSPIELENEFNLFFKKDDPLVILDIGSCDGLDSIKYSIYFKNAQIYAFEPISYNIDLLKKNVGLYGASRIEVIPLALSNEKGEATFYLSSGKPDNAKEEFDFEYGNKSSSLLEPDRTEEIYPWLKFERTEVVNTDKLSNFLKEKQIRIVDFIHMDVQGAELLVLEGAGCYMSNVRMIWMEVENISLYKNQPLKREVEIFMKGKGFTLVKSTVSSVAGDQLWVNLNHFSFLQKVKVHLSGFLKWL